MIPPSRLENTESTSDKGANSVTAARFHGASYADATIGDWHRPGATERGGDPFPSLDHNFYPQAKRREIKALSDNGRGQPAADLTPSLQSSADGILTYNPETLRADYIATDGFAMQQTREASSFTTADGNSHTFKNGEAVDQFKGVSVHRYRANSEAAQPTADDRPQAAIGNDGSISVANTDGTTINAKPGVDQNPPFLSLTTADGTYSAGENGQYYFTGRDGARLRLDQASALPNGAKLVDGKLTVGGYTFDGRGGIASSDGSLVEAQAGHVHAHFANGDGFGKGVDINAFRGANSVSSANGDLSIQAGDRIFCGDSRMHVVSADLKDGSISTPDVSFDGTGAHMRDGAGSGGQKEFAGGVPIREAIMSILNIADQLRASDSMTPEQRDILMSALTDFDSAKTACIGNGAFQELQFINGVSSAVSSFVGRRGLAGANPDGAEERADRASVVPGAGNLIGASGLLQSGFLPGGDPPTELSLSPRRELADAGGRTSDALSRVDDLAGMVSFHPGLDSSDAGWTSTDLPADAARLDPTLDGSLSTGNGKRISIVSKGRAEDSSNLGMTS